MARDPFYEMVYHRTDYTLADAFRPKPGWGCRRFTISVSLVGEHTEDDFVRAAAEDEAIPNGLRLTSVSLFPAEGNERVIWSTPPDHRMRQTPLPSAAPQAQATNEGHQP